MPIFEQAIFGALGGLAYGITGYLKATSNKEKLDLVKLGTTVGVGILAGIIAPYLGVNLEGAVSVLSNAGIVATVENVFKGILRR